MSLKHTQAIIVAPYPKYGVKSLITIKKQVLTLFSHDSKNTKPGCSVCSFYLFTCTAPKRGQSKQSINYSLVQKPPVQEANIA